MLYNMILHNKICNIKNNNEMKLKKNIYIYKIVKEKTSLKNYENRTI